MLSMMASSTSVIIVVALATACVCEVHEITVLKKLNNGDAIGKGINFTITLDAVASDNKNTLNVEFDFAQPADYTPFQESSLYFANDKKQITRITFGEKKVTREYFSKPWNPRESKEFSYPDVSPSNTNIDIDASWLPRQTTRISASILTSVDGKTPVLFNYYGIKNYPISLQDTMIVESYRPEDLTEITKGASSEWPDSS